MLVCLDSIMSKAFDLEGVPFLPSAVVPDGTATEDTASGKKRCQTGDTASGQERLLTASGQKRSKSNNLEDVDDDARSVKTSGSVE